MSVSWIPEPVPGYVIHITSHGVEYKTIHGLSWNDNDFVNHIETEWRVYAAVN